MPLNGLILVCCDAKTHDGAAADDDDDDDDDHD